jgi:hypothetical protein
MPPHRGKVKPMFNNPFLRTMQKVLRRISARKAASDVSDARLRALDEEGAHLKLDMIQRALKSNYYLKVREHQAHKESEKELHKLKKRKWVDQALSTLDCEISEDGDEDSEFDHSVKAEKAKPLIERILNYKAFMQRTALDRDKDLKQQQHAKPAFSDP